MHVQFSDAVFQFFRFVWASWRREGYWIPPNTYNSGRLHNLRCTSAVLRDCNMIELVHAKSTHTYATTRRLSGMHVGRASVMLSVFQFFRFVWASWRREGYWIPTKTCISGRLHNLMKMGDNCHQCDDIELCSWSGRGSWWNAIQYTGRVTL